MPLDTYGVWKGKVYPARIPSVQFSHAYIDLQNEPEAYHSHEPEAIRASINIRSGPFDETRLVYWLIQDLETRPHLEALPRGWNEIIHLATPDHRRISLDYLRGAIDHMESGEIVRDRDNIAEFLSAFIENAFIENATAYIYGQLNQENKTIHNVHMNQGNFTHFAKEDGIRQDGGILLEFSDGH